ncbi:hypothetical protein [Rhodococcus spongiicola]|uniref:Uncharacterized protein n=1 Tax=Rhodococcus spongiicola TaxID=2487352 RepID=A0A438AP93_9NOCA|nr:hypothetical protein [Rhodococcus spongiicola]RVW00490.1 hypothetical protein EF834_17800 [Rhodococcus spongiicola]
MVDTGSGSGDVLARLRQLTDADLLAIVLVVTAERPGLSPVHAAAAALSAGGLGPDYPPDPTRPAVPPEVPPPLTTASGPVTGPDRTVSDYTDAGVPTFERVRDRIEERFGTALGSEELERGSRAGRDLDEKWQAREKAAHEKLDEIRRSMKDDG